MRHTKGKLIVMDLREFGKEEISISNGEDKDSIVCRIMNLVKKAPLNDGDLANAERIVACWNTCNGVETDSLKRGLAGSDEPLLNLARRNQSLLDDCDEVIRKLRLARALAASKSAFDQHRSEKILEALMDKYAVTE